MFVKLKNIIKNHNGIKVFMGLVFNRLSDDMSCIRLYKNKVVLETPVELDPLELLLTEAELDNLELNLDNFTNLIFLYE